MASVYYYSGNLLPVVSAISANPASVATGNAVTLACTAADADGSVVSVEYFLDGVTKGVFINGPTFSAALPVTTVGQRVPSAVATDAFGVKSALFVGTAFAVTGANSVPAAPTNVTAVASNALVTINATAPINNGGAVITGYTLYRNGLAAPLAGAINVSLPYQDTSVVNGVPYSYEVAAVNSVGTGIKAAPTPAVTPQNAPLVIPGPSYHGPVATTTPSGSQVQALVAENWAFAPRPGISYNTNGTYPAFAEPAAYGLRTVKDVNGFVLQFTPVGDIIQTVINLTVNGVSISYNLYVHQNAQYDPAFILNF